MKYRYCFRIIIIFCCICATTWSSQIAFAQAAKNIQYYVFNLTNIASFGRVGALYVGTEESLKGKVRCSFSGGGVGCQPTDVVTYTKLLGPFSTKAEAQQALCNNITEQASLPLGAGLHAKWQGGAEWYNFRNASCKEIGGNVAAAIAQPGRPEKVEVLEVIGEVEVEPLGDASQAYALKPGMFMAESDRVVTGMDSRVKLRFRADNTIVWVEELTDMKVAAYSDVGNLVHTRLWLHGGRVVSWVNRESERHSRFEVKTPTATLGVRGTKFSVGYTKETGVSAIAVTEGIVDITPENKSLQKVTLTANQKVDVSANNISTISTAGTMNNHSNIAWGIVNEQAALNGTSLKYYVGTTHEQCRADCEANPACMGFTYVRAGGYKAGDPAMCYQMSDASGFVPNQCCISAVKNNAGNTISTESSIGLRTNASVKTLKKYYAINEQIVVEYEGLPGTNTDWIAIVSPNDPDGKYYTEYWSYTYSKKSGSYTFRGLPSPGQYQVRVIFSNNNEGYKVHSRFDFTVR